MITRYSLPEMAGLWTEENRFRRMLDVEIAVAESMASQGLIPRKSAQNIRRKAGFNLKEINKIEKVTKHDVTAFLKSVGKRVGKDARFIHLGITSSDVLDTGLWLQIREALDLILKRTRVLRAVLKTLSLKYKTTPIMGRTHGVHAEPTTFGLKMLLYYEEFGRAERRLLAARAGISFGKISGAVGTNATVAPVTEARALAKLGLAVAPVSTQVLQRDRHAEVMAAVAILGASLEKLSVEIRHLQRTEVREVEEGFSEGQTGSSAMPHKKNPVNCERVSGLARVLRGNLQAALENVALWHERDISHSSVERIILPDTFILADFMLDEMTRILKELRVYPQTMLANIARTRGLIFSQSLLLALIGKGMARFDAYAVVQELSMKVWKNESLDLETLARLDRRVKKLISLREIKSVFDLNRFLKNVNAIYRRTK